MQHGPKEKKCGGKCAFGFCVFSLNFLRNKILEFEVEIWHLDLIFGLVFT